MPAVPRRMRALALTPALLALIGCGEESGLRKSAENYPARSSLAVTPAAPPAGEAPPPSEDAAAKTDAPLPPATPRKIIYNARITVLVESVTAIGEQIAKLVKDAGGYVSETDQTSDPHTRRTASWTVRVPVERFEALLAAVGKVGEVQHTHLDSQDVTQEYYDIEARIANKQQEEKRLQKHLSESTGKLEDILAVERELSRVRGEIETMQGRIRYLANLTALSTMTITATEIRDYTPPVQATFSTQVSRTFSRSVENLRLFAKAIALAVVAVTPWLPVIALAVLPLIFFWRRRRVRSV